VRAWIDQLIGQGHLARTEDEYPTLTLTPAGAAVLRGEATPAPLTATSAPKSASRGEPVDVEAETSAASRTGPRSIVSPPPGAYDPELFERLRSLRRTIAEERGVPPYLVFSDASLRDMARLRPTTDDAFREVKGVGEWKAQTFGERFLAAIRRFPER
jgi:ATP-dependent DNA helicase RecQ